MKGLFLQRENETTTRLTLLSLRGLIASVLIECPLLVLLFSASSYRSRGSRPHSEAWCFVAVEMLQHSTESNRETRRLIFLMQGNNDFQIKILKVREIMQKKPLNHKPHKIIFCLFL